MKQIIVVKPNSLTPENKKLLLEAECVVIEHENPSEVRIITALEGLGDGDAIISSLIEAIEGTTSHDTIGRMKQMFTDNLLKKMNPK